MKPKRVKQLISTGREDLLVRLMTGRAKLEKCIRVEFLEFISGGEMGKVLFHREKHGESYSPFNV